MERAEGGFDDPSLPGFNKYDNMHYVKFSIVQETSTSQRPSTPQRLSDDK